MASKQEEMDENHEHVEYAVNLLKTIADSDEWCDIALVAGMDKQRYDLFGKSRLKVYLVGKKIRKFYFILQIPGTPQYNGSFE